MKCERFTSSGCKFIGLREFFVNDSIPLWLGVHFRLDNKNVISREEAMSRIEYEGMEGLGKLRKTNELINNLEGGRRGGG